MAARLRASRVAAMLRWAFGYLAMAVVIAIGFASLQGVERPERRVATAVTKHSAVRERQRAHEDADLEYIVDAGPGGHYLIEAVSMARRWSFWSIPAPRTSC
jgi:hypothetical protein